MREQDNDDMPMPDSEAWGHAAGTSAGGGASRREFLKVSAAVMTGGAAAPLLPGRALAQETLQFFAARKLTPITTYWALDTEAARFARSLEVRTERTYLYFEKRI